jgi:tetratricopeptide (TPR) repeat protein
MRRFIIVFYALAAISAVSCNGFLDIHPSNSSEASSSISSVADAKVAINGIMTTMCSTSYYGRNFMLYGDIKGGDLTICSAGRGLDALYSFNQSAQSNSFGSFWSTGYDCIMQINNLIENIERLQGEGADGFSYYLGEALTLRALVYFDMVRLYGLPYSYDKDSYGVPDVTTVLSPSATPGRATVAENYNRILSDLKEAEPLMSSDKSPVNGNVGYYANIALQARVYLYMQNYDAALAAAREIIDDKAYKLYEPSEWVDSWSRQFGSESILELNIDTQTDLGTESIGYYMIRYHQLKNAQGWFLASDYYLNRLGEDPSDVRWGVMDNDEYGEDKGIVRNGACYKYMGGLSMAGDGKETATAVNVKIIRLSEIYLIAAEAELHSSAPDKGLAAGYLNEIRRRSPALPLATAATISDDMILDERSKELFGEGQRFFDMIRMNRSIEYNDDLNDVPVSARSKTIDRTFGKIVLPIPQDEINANPVIALQQNSAY